MRIFSIILIGTLLTACAVGPNYVKPPVKVPMKFKETSKNWRPAKPNDDFNRGQWWAIFKNPELNSLEMKLNISNQTIANSVAQYQQAWALVDEASASFYPLVTTAASITRQRQASAGANSATAATATSDATSTTPSTTTSFGAARSGISTTHSILLNVSWEPDIWGVIRRQVEANKSNAQATEAQLALARLSAQASLAQFYFELRGLDQDQRLLDDNVKNYKKTLTVVQHQYQSGTSARADVIQAQTQLESAQALAINNGVNRAIYEHAIAVLIGEPASTFSLKPHIIHATIPTPPSIIPCELLERRPDIASSERLMSQANAQIGIAIGAFFPNLTLSSSGSVQNRGFARWFSYPLLNWAVGPALSATLFDGGLRTATVQAARANYRATIATYRQTVLAAFQDVEDNLSTLRILQTQQSINDKAASDARLASDLVLNQYKAGTVPFSFVLTAQTTAFTAEITAADTKYLRMNAMVGLIKALGGGWSVCNRCKV